MTPDQEERLTQAAERAADAFVRLAAAVTTLTGHTHALADAVDLIAMTNDARFTVEHPPKGEPSDIWVTKTPTEEDLIREAHGGDDADAPIERWIAIGPRETRWETARNEKAAADAGDGTPGTPRRGPSEI